MYLDAIFYFALLMLIFALSDIISTATKAAIPSMFAISVFCVILFWGGLAPTNILELAGISSTLVYVVYYLQLPHMGSLMSVKEISVQWKTIIVCVAGLIGMCLATMTLGLLIFGKLAATVATPPLTGGIVAYLIVSEQAVAMGRQDMATLALAVLVLQSFVGYPLTSFLLKKEAKRLIFKFRNGEREGSDEKLAEAKKPIFPQLPEKYVTDNVVLFKVSVAGLIGILITVATKEFLSRYVILLIVGVILSEIGFLDRKPLIKSEVFGFTSVVIVGYVVVSGIAAASPETVLSMLIPAMGIIVIGCIGLCIAAAVAGRFVGFHKEMAMSVALTALYGYPGNFILSQESVKAVAENKEESEYLTSRIEPQMIVGGFTTVTIASVIVASIFIKLFF